MKEKVIRLGCTWLYGLAPIETKIQEEFDELAAVPITDRATPQVCILRKGRNYGIYTLSHTDGYGGPGTWCNTTLDPFPYDEVKYRSFAFDYGHQYGVFAFRIGEKWGILKVVDGDNEEKGVYDVELGLTKRKIVVPCEYVALADAELQLGEKFDWKDPFAHDF